jgi:formylglycine-generating enzyme required for sulfatase activity
MPVTYVSLNEARAYCAWAQKRLPHSYEWQYAAQGTDGRLYPWGNNDDQSRYPKQQSGNNFMGPEPVTAYTPAGDSPFGISDLVGNVWQYTDEFMDSHTRSVVLMGGSNYRPLGSLWYFPQAKRLNTHEKYMLMDDCYERAGTIGFRCLADSTEESKMLFML